MMEKDYELLREFDLEAAKRGEPICTNAGQPIELIAEAGSDDKHAIRLGAWHSKAGCIARWRSDYIAMAPLALVEGKPVYKGDVLWHKIGKMNVTVEKGGDADYFYSGGMCYEYRYTTWTPPKMKREGWVNVSNKSANSVWAEEVNGLLSHSYASKQDADKYALPHRIACVRIEWEE